MLGYRQIMGYAGVGGFFYGGAFAYIAGSPFASISYHHASPQMYRWLGFRHHRHHDCQPAEFALSKALRQRQADDRRDRSWTLAGLYAVVRLGWLVWTGATAVFINVVCRPDRRECHCGFLTRYPATSWRSVGGIAGSALVGLLADGTPRPMAFTIAAMGIGSLLCARSSWCGHVQPDDDYL